MNTDHWFYGLFQGTPDLITLLLPAVTGVAGLDPDEPGDRHYCFAAPELKAVNHRLDGVLWPREHRNGTPSRPVVLLEVQMHSANGFLHRLAAQSYRFLQQHPEVLHLLVVVVVPHRRLNLGPEQLPEPLQTFVDAVIWLNLQDLIDQPDLDPLLQLLTLPVRPESDLRRSSRQILDHRPDLVTVVLPMLIERFPTRTPEDIMEIVGLTTDHLRHTLTAQMLLEEGREEGRQEGQALGEAAVTIRLLNRRCGPLSEATRSRIQTLPLDQLVALSEALLDFSGPDDLAQWLTDPTG